MMISDKSNEPWNEASQILRQCHSGPCGGQHGIATTARKVYEARFNWPNIFRDAQILVRSCDACQRAGNISTRDETPQKYIQIKELDELRLDAYESSILYKERIMKWHEKRIKALTEYEKGDKGHEGGAIKLSDKEGNELIVNKQRVKPYKSDVVNFDREEDAILEDEGGFTLYFMRRSPEALRIFT
ncbi:reverse transcriptase domain-containing protein [Tanacetum coccineum]